ncbi:hypothetical protein [Thalassotalea sp. ND16A]|uniref:hypothetical protein n=1 Tax=Thalassotalea sp. ND16A TaxID=1535422 RepID=UPI00051A7BBC|nr:hypothetical protein [Thalassotalea sp. ND16A]KGJ87889.1 hypothetical protein ND16A_2803 [Thalassotalea sp. ND16A]
MARQGSGGNVLAAICCIFIPGLGQLVQGRIFAALLFFVFSGILYFTWVFWIVGALLHLWSIIDAAKYRSSSPLTE